MAACLQLEWDKGKALAHLLDALGLDDDSNVLPIYLGDDQTDEDAFRVLRLRNDGLGILVSNKVSPLQWQQGCTGLWNLSGIPHELVHQSWMHMLLAQT